MNSAPAKPLGHRAYGTIPHLLGSRRGPGDKGVNEGQHRICCEKRRDKFDVVVVQEKLDGSNVAIANIDGEIVPLIRSGYRATSSHRSQHQIFHAWVMERAGSFAALLEPGERLCGEWLALAHGTRYDLTNRSPFVAFDIMQGQERRTHLDFYQEVEWCVDTKLFDVAPLLLVGGPWTIEQSLAALTKFGRYGALDEAEGVVYRVERNGKVDFLAKYVRPGKVDGAYFDVELWNWRPMKGVA